MGKYNFLLHAYGPDRYTIRRYKKTAGEYRQQSKFTISSNDQARRIVDALTRWMSESEASEAVDEA